MNRHLSRSLLLLVAALLAAANLTYGQTSEVTGRVADRNTAVVPGTEVSISSVETGVSGKAVTNDEGYYTIPLLQPGAYQLTPGVLGSNSANGQFGDIAVNTTFDSNFSINGGRSQSNEVTIDGVPSTDRFFNQITTIPSVEAAQEFKVESNNVSAEYGRFGGGPVWLPKRIFGPASYDGRQRTCFFADYQGMRWRRGDVFFTSVPTELERHGDFSQTRDAQGRLVTIYDPLTTRANPNYNSGQPISATNMPFIRTPFAGNVIPQDRLDPIAREIIKYYPLPNNQGQQFTNINNFASNAKRRMDGDQYSARVDHHFSESYRTFVGFSRNESTLTQPDYFNNVASPNPGAVGTTPFRQHTIATITPSCSIRRRFSIFVTATRAGSKRA